MLVKMIAIFWPITFALLLTVALPPVLSQNTSDLQQLETYFHDKCLKNSGISQSFDKLRNDVYQMYKYFQYAIEYLPKQKELFCGDERKKLKTKAIEIEADLKVCLGNEEKYLAEFFRGSFVEFLHFLCHRSGEYTTRFFDRGGPQCVENFEKSQSNDLNNCMNRIFPPGKRNGATKTEMCENLTVVKRCFKQLVEEYCPSSYDVKELNIVLFDYISRPCSGQLGVLASNSLIFVGLSLIALFKLN